VRFLAFSDVHGSETAVKRLVSEVEGEDFEFILIAGDITNALLTGAEEGQRQARSISDILSTLGRPIYFVYGNRDYPPRSRRPVEFPAGTPLENGSREVGDGYVLTSDVARVDPSSILVTHSLHPLLAKLRSPALIYLYGHDHQARVYKNYVDLGFLYRDKEAHGASRSLFGCYWFIEVDGEEFSFENHRWQLRESRCPVHPGQGVFYIPFNWRKACPLCYDEERYLFPF